jgi:hypothetical protein
MKLSFEALVDDVRASQTVTTTEFEVLDLRI